MALRKKSGAVAGRRMDYASRAIFGLCSGGLMLMSLALSFYGIFEMAVAFYRFPQGTGDALLGAIGYLVIAVAVFDVAKYFVEEEVIRGREMRIASEARRSLTKFVSTIAIAVFIEGLVMVFRGSKGDNTSNLLPTFVLLSGVLIIVGLGLFQWLSAGVEIEVDAKDKAAERSGE